MGAVPRRLIKVSRSAAGGNAVSSDKAGSTSGSNGGGLWVLLVVMAPSPSTCRTKGRHGA